MFSLGGQGDLSKTGRLTSDVNDQASNSSISCSNCRGLQGHRNKSVVKADKEGREI